MFRRRIPIHPYVWGACCACPCATPGWTFPVGREEFIESLEDYKAKLEAEVSSLERRIKALREEAT